MRKLKINSKDEVGLRPSKTPSPINNQYFRSPRSNRNLNGHMFDSNKRVQYQEHRYNIPKEKQPFDAFKSYLLETKQKQNTIEQSKEAQKRQKQNKTIKAYNLVQNSKKYETDSDSNPYNSYFLPHHSSIIKKQNNKQFGNVANSKQISRRSSLSRDQSQQSQQSARNNYQQTIRKLANQNIRLRHQCKVIQQKYQRSLHDKNDTATQKNYLKAQLQRLNRINQELVLKQNSLIQQIKSLKKILSINSQQLSQSNYQIYKMKQQIFQLSVNKQKMQARFQLRQAPKPNNLSQSKYVSFGSSKNISTQTTIDSRQTRQNKVCKACKSSSRTIAQLVTDNENLRFQNNDKNVIIESLCQQITRIQNEFRLLEKPRTIFKKLSHMATQLGNQLVLQKVKQLNLKYAKYYK